MDFLTEGVKALICGMVTVFVVLIAIAYIIHLFKFIKPANKKNNPVSAAVSEVVVTQTVPVVSTQVQDDLELIAVITAAIASSLGTSVDKLVVTSFRKINSNSKWLNR